MMDPRKSIPKRALKKIISIETKKRRKGEWGRWKTHTFAKGMGGKGWAGEVRIAYTNDVFSVLVRDIECAIHYAISSASERRPSFYEMQRIKDELAGEGATAVEVYPPKSEIVDGANMYHFWVLPKPLPFSLKKRASQ